MASVKEQRNKPTSPTTAPEVGHHYGYPLKLTKNSNENKKKNSQRPTMPLKMKILDNFAPQRNHPQDKQKSRYFH